MSGDLTEYAIFGWEAYASNPYAQSPHIHTSPADMAWQAGRHMRKLGRVRPFEVRSGRGCKIHINRCVLEIQYPRGTLPGVKEIMMAAR